MGSPLRTIQYLIRQRIARPYDWRDTPGFAGETLGEQVEADDETTRPRIVGAPPFPPRTDEFAPYEGSLPAGTFMGDAPAPPNRSYTPVRDLKESYSAVRLPSPAASPIAEPPIPEMSPPPYGPTMRDFRTGEPHREFYERGMGSPYDEKRAYMNALQNWQPRGGRGLRDILKSTALSALTGMAATPDNPLAGAAGGAAFGLGGQLVDPRLSGLLTKNLKLRREQGLLNQQMETDLRQATLERMRAQTEEAQADLIPDPDRPGRMMPRPAQRAPHYIERSDGVYEVSSAYPEGRKVGNIPAEAKASARTPIHYFDRADGVYGAYEDSQGKVQSFKVESIPGKPVSDAQEAQAAEGEAIATSTAEAANVLKAELDGHKGQLKENERAIRAKSTWLKRRAAEILATDPDLRAQALISPSEARKAAEERAKAEDQDVQSGVYDELLGNTDALKEAIKDKQKRYDDMQEDIRKGRAKGARGGSRGTTTGKYAGLRISKSKLPEAAKRLGMTVPEAEAYLKREQAIIY